MIFRHTDNSNCILMDEHRWVRPKALPTSCSLHNSSSSKPGAPCLMFPTKGMRNTSGMFPCSWWWAQRCLLFHPEGTNRKQTHRSWVHSFWCSSSKISQWTWPALTHVWRAKRKHQEHWRSLATSTHELGSLPFSHLSVWQGCQSQKALLGLRGEHARTEKLVKY